MKEKLEQFHKFMMQYEEFITEMAHIEDQKYRDLIAGDINEIDKTMAKQQAMLMKLTNLEDMRMQLQKNMGYDNYTFSQILDALDDSSKKKFSGLFERLIRLMAQIKVSNQKSLSYAKMSLQVGSALTGREFEDALHDLVVKKDQTSDREGSMAGRVFETKV